MLNNIKGCAEALRETAPEIDILINEPMRRHTTFSIGGPADLFILPKHAQGADRRARGAACTGRSDAAARQRLEYSGLG